VNSNGNGVYGLDLIFIDGYGLIQIKGTKTGSGDMTADLKFNVFGTYEEALEQAAANAAAQCGTTLTYAQCLGYNYPQGFWWQQPALPTPDQQIINSAESTLDDPAQTHTLGTLTFSLSRVMNQ
jgi:hypothetical protein